MSKYIVESCCPGGGTTIVLSDAGLDFTGSTYFVVYEGQCYQIVDETTVPVSNLPYLVPNLYTDCIDCANQNILASQCPTPTPTTTPLPTLSPTFTPTNSVTPTQTKPIVYKTVDTIMECPGSTFEGNIFNFNIPDDGISWGAFSLVLHVSRLLVILHIIQDGTKFHTRIFI